MSTGGNRKVSVKNGRNRCVQKLFIQSYQGIINANGHAIKEVNRREIIITFAKILGNYFKGSSKGVDFGQVRWKYDRR